MANFWCVSAPLYSHTDWGGFLKTAEALRERGHYVQWISEKELAGAFVQKEIPFKEIAETGWLWPPPPPPDLTGIPPQEAVNLRYKRALDTWLSEDLVAQGVEALLKLAEKDGKPDAILTDPFLSACALAAEKLDVPLFVMGWPAQGNLDENELFPVQRDLSSDSMQRITRLCEKFGIEGVNFSKGTAPSIRSPHLHVTYFTPDWYGAELSMMLPQTHFVGGQHKQATSEPPSWLKEIPDDQPLAMVTLGTVFTGDLGFFSWAAQAAAHAGLIPVVAVGWNPVPPPKILELKRALPGGTRLMAWAPFEHVLPRCELILHHGGMGTTHAAVTHGLRQIVVPHAADQRIQAKRVAQAKVGLQLNAMEVQQGQLHEGAKALMEADWVADKARDLAQRMAALGGAEKAADLVLETLEKLQ